jgi:hypothetical protein
VAYQESITLFILWQIINSVIIVITLNNITCEKYFSKYRCFFNILLHEDIINKLRIIEENILGKYQILDKIPQYKIYDANFAHAYSSSWWNKPSYFEWDRRWHLW